MSLTKNLQSITAKWPVAIVAFGMMLTLVWMVALVWLFMTATGFAAVALISG